MIKAYCKDNITFRSASRDQWGTVTFTDSTVKGRIEFKTKLVRNLQGEQVVSTASVLLPLMTITHDDKVNYNGIEYSILSIQEAKDLTGRFMRVYLA